MLEWGPSPREAPQENRKETLLWPEEWGSICCSSVRSPTPSHTQPFQIKWEVYFSKDLCRSSLLYRHYDFACICIMLLFNNVAVDETINFIISECSKLTQKKYMTRHNRVGNVIHWKLCKKLNFDLTNKWYMHKPESIPENEIPKILWSFEIQTDYLIPPRRPDLVMINNNNKKR